MTSNLCNWLTTLYKIYFWDTQCSRLSAMSFYGRSPRLAIRNGKRK